MGGSRSGSEEPPSRPSPYKPGSWGPKEADALIRAAGGWHNPMPDEETA